MLDLDLTLAYGWTDGSDNFPRDDILDKRIPFDPKNDHSVKFLLRPGAEDLIEKVIEKVDLVLYTHAKQEYAHTILKELLGLNKSDRIKFRFHHDDTEEIPLTRYANGKAQIVLKGSSLYSDELGRIELNRMTILICRHQKGLGKNSER